MTKHIETRIEEDEIVYPIFEEQEYLQLIFDLPHINPKLQYGLAKELSLIRLNLLFDRNTIESTIKRLTSFIDHIKVACKKGNEELVEWVEEQIKMLTHIQE